jgi:flagellar basal-body rod protein FlgC
MSINKSLEASASGLTAERLRMDVIAGNVANVHTTRTASGGPYRRKHVVFEAIDEKAGPFQRFLINAGQRPRSGGGVRVSEIAEDQGPLKRVHDPSHPDRDADGYVSLPNIEPVMEMVDLMTAQRAYDAGVTALNAAKQMQQRALDIGKG